MKILAFDTSNNVVSVAVSLGEKILAFEQELRPSMQAERLIQMIESALNSAKLSYHDLDYLSVVKGPGSFTGIRIGLAAAQGILFGANNIQGIGVTNFDIMYFRAITQIKIWDKVVVILNAYRSQLYIQIFEKYSKKSKPMLVDYDFVIDKLNQADDKILCIGSGLQLIGNDIKDLSNITILPRFTRVKAIHICRYVASFAEKENLNRDILPLYIREADAKLPEVN